MSDWDSIINDPSFQKQNAATKMRVASNYYAKHILSDPEFRSQPIEVQAKVKRNFYASTGIAAPKELTPDTFKYRHPNLYSAGKAIAQTFQDIPRTIMHGVTLGVSERIRELGLKAAEKATNSAIPDPSPYQNIPSTTRTIGEFTGAAVPIGTGFKVAKPAVAKAARTIMKGSRFAEPVAAVTTGAGLGSLYTTAEKGIQEGKLPTAKEIGISAATWGGMEVLGMGIEYGLALRELSKVWGMSLRETQKIVRKEAMDAGLPNLEHIITKAKVQKTLAAMENTTMGPQRVVAATAFQNAQQAAEGYTKKVKELLLRYSQKQGRVGTYGDLTASLKGEEIGSRVNEYTGLDRPVIIGGQGKPITSDLYDIKLQEALATPPHLQTAEQKLLIRGQGREGLPREARVEPKPLETVTEGRLPRERITETEILDKPLKNITKEPYSGTGEIIIGENGRPLPFNAQEASKEIAEKERLDKIIQTPQFLQTAEDRAFLNSRKKHIEQPMSTNPPRERIVIGEGGKATGKEIVEPPLKKTVPKQQSKLVKRAKKTAQDTTLRSSAGLVAGIEQDEEGDVRYDFGKGVAGMAGVALLGKGLSKTKKPSITTSTSKVDVSKLTKDQIAVREKLIRGAASTGQSVEQFMQKAGAKQEFINDVKAYQEATHVSRLSNTMKSSDATIPLPKRARSINLERQNIPDNLKQFEAEMTSSWGPKQKETIKETIKKAEQNVLSDIEKSVDAIKKAKAGRGLSREEGYAIRQINVNALDELQNIVRHGTPEDIISNFNSYQENIAKAVDKAGSEAGGLLRIFREEVAINRLASSFSKMKRSMNEREMAEFKKLNLQDPIAIKHFTERLGDPKLMDYVYEFFYNNILSGIPTHIVNVASNTLWMGTLLGRRVTSGVLDGLVSKFTGKNRQIFASEIVPMLAGMKRGAPKGMAGAKEIWKTGRLDGYESKWGRELGGAISSAFERSPYRALRKAAPYLTFPRRSLQAMDVFANSMAYDAELQALLHRTGAQKGLKGEQLKEYVNDMLHKPESIPAPLIEEAGKFAQYSTFTDDPGWISTAFIRLRNMGFESERIGKVEPLRFVVPFVLTIGNLVKRGLEITPGVGMAFAKGNKPADVIAKQFEGSILAMATMYKIAKGEITGSVPKDENEREAFYRDGKLPWAIKVGDNWYQYRRIEPFNTVISATVNAYQQIQNAKSGKDAADIAVDVVSNFVSNVIDSGYLANVSAMLDQYGKRQGMLQRTATAFVPYSGFFRSINRALEAGMNDNAKYRESSTWKGAFSQVIPFMHNSQPVQLDVFGKEKVLAGGPLRQFSPYKYSADSNDPVEKELARLKYYPGLPNKNVKIGELTIPIPEDTYRQYVMAVGSDMKEYYKTAINHPDYKAWSDDEKRNHLKSTFEETRAEFHSEVRAISFVAAYRKAKPEEQKKMAEALEKSKVSDDVYNMIQEELEKRK